MERTYRPPKWNASHRGRQLWRQIAHGHSRVIFDTPRCPFAPLQEAYALDDDALLAAIDAHSATASNYTRYAGHETVRGELSFAKGATHLVGERLNEVGGRRSRRRRDVYLGWHSGH